MTAGAGTLRRRRREPAVALINVVFLLLVFFLIAGTLARPLPEGLELVQLHEGAAQAPHDAIAILPDGRMLRGGAPLGPEALPALVAELDQTGAPVRLMPDRDLPAVVLARIMRSLTEAGARDLRLVAGRGPP